MKIAYIVPSLASKAPIAVCKMLADYFSSLGHEVIVYYFDEIKEITFLCPVKKIKFNDDIDFDYYDIIHSHCRRPDIYLAKRKKKIKKAKIISTIHCDIIEDLSWIYGKVIASIFGKKWINALKRFDVTVELNPFLMEKYNYFQKNVLIPNGIEIFTDETDKHKIIMNKIEKLKQQNFIVLVSFSVIIRRKGLDQVIKFLEINPTFCFICIGSGPYKYKLQKMVNDKALGERVFFYESIPRPYLVLREADLFIFPSYSEGQGLTLLEAGYMNCPVVCSDIPAFRVFSENEVTFFKPKNIESLSNSINQALLLRNKVSQLRKKLNELYTISVMRKKYESLYFSLINIIV